MRSSETIKPPKERSPGFKRRQTLQMERPKQDIGMLENSKKDDLLDFKPITSFNKRQMYKKSSTHHNSTS